MSQPTINLQSIFINGASLEIPDRARMFGLSGEHPVNINVSTAHRQLDKNIFEVSVKVLVDAKHAEKDLYVVELTQAAVFQIEAEDSLMQHILFVVCPTIILPYLRANFADYLLRAQLPIMHLPDVNWVIPEAPSAANDAAPVVH